MACRAGPGKFMSVVLALGGREADDRKAETHGLPQLCWHGAEAAAAAQQPDLMFRLWIKRLASFAARSELPRYQVDHRRVLHVVAPLSVDTLLRVSSHF